MYTCNDFGGYITGGKKRIKRHIVKVSGSGQGYTDERDQKMSRRSYQPSRHPTSRNELEDVKVSPTFRKYTASVQSILRVDARNTHHRHQSSISKFRSHYTSRSHLPSHQRTSIGWPEYSRGAMNRCMTPLETVNNRRISKQTNFSVLTSAHCCGHLEEERLGPGLRTPTTKS